MIDRSCTESAGTGRSGAESSTGGRSAGTATERAADGRFAALAITVVYR